MIQYVITAKPFSKRFLATSRFKHKVEYSTCDRSKRPVLKLAVLSQTPFLDSGGFTPEVSKIVYLCPPDPAVRHHFNFIESG